MISVPVVSYCQNISSVTASVCLSIQFEACSFCVNASLIYGKLELPLYSKCYLLSEWQYFFSDNLCLNYMNCTACFLWDKLFMNSTYLYGCAAVNFSCISGISYSPLSLGCFQDSNILPQCWAICPSNCSNRGSCQMGKCNCSNGWKGRDCSVVPSCISNGCSNHGSCTDQGLCHCDSDYTGENCSIYIDTDTNANHSNSQIIGVVILLILIVALLGFLICTGLVIWYLIKRRRGNQISMSHFNRLYDILEDYDLDEQEHTELQGSMEDSKNGNSTVQVNELESRSTDISTNNSNRTPIVSSEGLFD